MTHLYVEYPQKYNVEEIFSIFKKINEFKKE